MSDGLDVDEFLAGYLIEAEEHLRSSNHNLLAADDASRRGAIDPRAVRELFRSLHTLKGLSAMIGAEAIVELAHEMESVLRTADRAGGRLPGASVDVLFRGVRAVGERFAQLARREPLTPVPAALIEEVAALELAPATADGDGPTLALALEPELVAKLSSGERNELVQGVADGRRALRVDFVPSPERAAAGTTITTIRERVSAVATLVKVLPRAVPPSDDGPGGVAFVLLVLTSADDAALAAAASAAPADVAVLLPPRVAQPGELDDVADVHRPDVVRVEIQRLDDALDALASLVVGRSRLEREVERLAGVGADVRGMRLVLREHGNQLRALRTAIMRARVVRVAELLERAPLIVRGLTRSSGKRVRLAIDAGAAELDKSVGERLVPVIVHLLRNAVDHAIELPEARRAAGKPAEGLIEISCAEHGGSQLELRMTDDGRGIDAAAVARRAGVAVPPDDRGLLALLARPGLSTLDAATSTSGRGVGMEIVKRIVVDELGGELTLATAPGRGTTFTLRVPISVTILDAFGLATGGETFVVPAAAVVDLAEIEPERVVASPRVGRRGADARILRHRGAEVPLYRLTALLGGSGEPVARPKAIVVRGPDGAVAFEVDRLLGRQEIVVRPIVDPLARVGGVSGTTDLGDGRPTLVLDLLGLLAGGQRRPGVAA